MSSTSEANKNVVITVAARQKLVQARAGAITLPKVVGMAFGDGGVDSGGTVMPPTENQQTLNSELYRKEIDKYTVAADGLSVRYECTLEESELAGEEISECGLYDEDGDII